MKARLVVVLLAVALAAAAVSGAVAGTAADRPDGLDLPVGWQPEGIAEGNGWDLLVGSIATGAVLRLDARNGETKTLVPAHEGRAATGLKLAWGRRLFVSGGPTGKAFVYDGRTGADVATLQLATAGASTFINDVAVTRSTAYFTDSMRSAIYAVDINRLTVRTIALPDIPNETGFNLNGIVTTPDQRALLAVQTNTGKLWRIDPAGGHAVAVDLGGTSLKNGDGLFLNGHTLYAVQNVDNQIAVVRLSEDFTKGELVRTIKSTGFDVPTTIAMLHGDLYAVNARFGVADPQKAAYRVTLVRR